jgi:hypothetical protein
MDNKKLPTLLGWKGKISTNREHYLSVSSFINFFLILLVNKQMHDLTNLHQCFINIILPSQQLLGSSSFCYILYSLHLIQIGDTNTSKSRAYTNSNIATTSTIVLDKEYISTGQF